MKKIALLFLSAGLFFTIDASAQKSKSKSKSKANSEAAKAAKAERERLAAEEAEKDKAEAEAYEMARLSKIKMERDSIEMERITDSTKEHNRYLKDSMNKVNAENERMAHEKRDRLNKNHDDAYKAAGLNDYQGQQVKDINQTYHARAKAIRDDASLTDDQKKVKLYALNKERVKKIKDIVGRKKADAYEQARAQSTDPEDSDAHWANENGKKPKKEKSKKKVKSDS